MKEATIRDTYELIRKETQTIITICYFLIVGIGMLFTYQKYSEFGINIFDYADIFDFLIAPFSDFRIMLFSAVTIILVFLLLRFDQFYQKIHPESYSKMNFGLDKKSWFSLYRYSLYIFLFVFYLYISADYYGRFTKDKIGDQSTISLKYSDNQIINGILIGKTDDILFLLQGQKVKAIPINSLVKEFEIE